MAPKSHREPVMIPFYTLRRYLYPLFKHRDEALRYSSLNTLYTDVVGTIRHQSFGLVAACLVVL